MISCGHETGKGGDVRVCIIHSHYVIVHYCRIYVVGIFIYILLYVCLYFVYIVMMLG